MVDGRSHRTIMSSLSSSSLALYVVDRAGLVQFWNPACEQLTGWAASDALGRYLPTIDRESRREFDDLREDVFNGKTFVGLERTRHHHDGHLIELSITTAPCATATAPHERCWALFTTSPLAAKRKPQCCTTQF